MAKGTPQDIAVGRYVLPIDASWNLTDLYEFPHVYEQVYAFLASFYVQAPSGDVEDSTAWDDDEYAHAFHTFRAYPWWGGYSAVNFYNSLRSNMPRRWRPTIQSMQYASPGWIELSLAVTIALNIKTIIGHLVSSAGQINKLYGTIQKEIVVRKLQRIEVRKKELALQKADLEFALEAGEKLSNALGFGSLAELQRRTDNPLATLRILLSFYRRLRTLSTFVSNGKVNILASGPRKIDSGDERDIAK